MPTSLSRRRLGHWALELALLAAVGVAVAAGASVWRRTRPIATFTAALKRPPVFSPSGRGIAVPRSGVPQDGIATTDWHVCSVETGAELRVLSHVRRFWPRSGTVFRDLPDGTSVFEDMETGTPRGVLPADVRLRSLALSPRGDAIAWIVSGTATCDVEIRPLGSPAPVTLLEGHVSDSGYLDWSPDGTRVALEHSDFSGEHEVRVWSTRTGRLELKADLELVGFSSKGEVLTLSDTSKAPGILATAQDKKEHWLVDRTFTSLDLAASGNRIALLEDEENETLDSGSRAARAPAKVVVVLDLATGATVWRQVRRTEFRLSPDGERLALTQGGVVEVWELPP